MECRENNDETRVFVGEESFQLYKAGCTHKGTKRYSVQLSLCILY